METVTVKVKLFKFSELSPAAKDAARQWHESLGDWSRDTEYMASLKALAEHFDGKLRDWSIDWSGCAGSSFVEFDMPEREESSHAEDNVSKKAWESNIRLKLRELGRFNRRTLKGNGDCKLTGYGTDEDAIDGFRWAFYRDGERDLNVLLQAAFDSWIKSAHENYAYDYGDEGLGETSDANNWRYTESGKFWAGVR